MEHSREEVISFCRLYTAVPEQEEEEECGTQPGGSNQFLQALHSSPEQEEEECATELGGSNQFLQALDSSS